MPSRFANWIDSEVESSSRQWSRAGRWRALLALPWALGFALLSIESTQYHTAAKRQRIVPGQITKHEPANHNSYVYVFSVDGRSFVGRESPVKNELSIGQQVSVYYDAQNPNRNSLKDLDDVAMERFGPTPVLFAGICIWVVYFVRKREPAPTVVPSQDQKD